MATTPCPLAAQKRGSDSAGQYRACSPVAHAARRLCRDAVGVGERVGEPGVGPECPVVIAGLISQGRFQAPSGDLRNHEARIEGRKRGGVDT